MKLFSLGFVVLSKVKKTSLHLLAQKKKKSSKQETKMKVSALLFFSAISKSVLQVVLLKLYQHCLLTQNNEIVLYRKSSDEKTTKDKPLRSPVNTVNLFFTKTILKVSAPLNSLLTLEL
jgi:hypothetical protein